MLVLPTIDETPGPLRDDAGTIVYPGFPADDLYHFRLYSLGTQFVCGRRSVCVFAALISRCSMASATEDEQRGAERAGARVSEVVRLTLVSHAMTDAMAAGRFPTDEPLNAVGQRQLDACDRLRRQRIQRATAGRRNGPGRPPNCSGCRPAIEPRLADLDCGRWRGDVLGGVLPADLAVWLTDPTRAPHGGESVVDLIDRVRGWLDSLTDPSHAAGRGHPPGGGSCRDPVGPRRAAEVVLAHRHCAGQPDGDALPRPRLDAAHPTWLSRRATSANACLAIDISQAPRVGPRNRGQFIWKLTTHGCPVRSTAYQLNVKSPGRFPALAPMYGHLARSRSMPGIADRICRDRRRRTDRGRLQRSVHPADVVRAAVPLGAVGLRRACGCAAGSGS